MAATIRIEQPLGYKLQNKTTMIMHAGLEGDTD